MRKYRVETYTVFRMQWQIHMKKHCSESSCLCLPSQCLTVRNKMQNCSWCLIFFSPHWSKHKVPTKTLVHDFIRCKTDLFGNHSVLHQCENVALSFFPFFLGGGFKMWAALCSHGNNIHDDEMSFFHVIDPTRSIAIFNKNRVSIPFSFFGSNCDVLKCGNGDETFWTAPYLSFYSCCHRLSGGERFNSTWLQKTSSASLHLKNLCPAEKGTENGCNYSGNTGASEWNHLQITKPDVAQSPRRPDKIVIVFGKKPKEACGKTAREKNPASSADVFLLPPLWRRVCVASGLAGCTSLLHKYCTSGAWWKPTLRSGTTALWRASLSTVYG